MNKVKNDWISPHSTIIVVEAKFLGNRFRQNSHLVCPTRMLWLPAICGTLYHDCDWEHKAQEILQKAIMNNLVVGYYYALMWATGYMLAPNFMKHNNFANIMCLQIFFLLSLLRHRWHDSTNLVTKQCPREKKY